MSERNGYQPNKTTTGSVTPPNTGSHVKVKKNGYTWEEMDKAWWEGFYTCKKKMNKKIADLEKQNTNLQTMLKAEREVRCNEEYLKKVTELEAENEQLQQKYLSESYEKSKLVSQIEQAKKVLKDIITWAEREGPGCPKFDNIKKNIERILNE